MTVHPRQLLLDGRTHAEAIASPRPGRLTPGRSAVLEALGAAGRPLTLAELTAALHDEPDPRGWVHGDYPTTWLARVAGIVRRMEAAGLVDVAWGPLSHRRQVGVVVSLVGKRPPSHESSDAPKKQAPSASPGWESGERHAKLATPPVVVVATTGGRPLLPGASCVAGGRDVESVHRGCVGGNGRRAQREEST